MDSEDKQHNPLFHNNHPTKFKIQSPMPLLAKGKIYADDDDHL